MGKYTKWALVLLYLLQLVIVFREQLAHLYRSAVESVQHRTDAAVPPPPSGRQKASGVSDIGRPAPAQAIMASTAALAAATATVSSAGDDDGDEMHGHDDDDKKDRIRRLRRPRRHEFLLHNLFASIRRAALHPGAAAGRASDIVHVLLMAERTA